MEDQVHSLHALWKLECTRMRAGSCYDLKWTKVLLSQLLGWPGRVEILGLNKGRGPNLKGRCRNPSGVRRPLISLLSKAHLISEEFMEGSKIDGVLLCTYGCQVSLGMDGKVWMVSLVGKERSDPCGGIRSVVVHELSQGQKV